VVTCLKNVLGVLLEFCQGKDCTLSHLKCLSGQDSVVWRETSGLRTTGYVFVCMCVRVRVCVCVCMYICICIRLLPTAYNNKSSSSPSQGNLQVTKEKKSVTFLCCLVRIAASVAIWCSERSKHSVHSVQSIPNVALFVASARRGLWPSCSPDLRCCDFYF